MCDLRAPFAPAPGNRGPSLFLRPSTNPEMRIVPRFSTRALLTSRQCHAASLIFAHFYTLPTRKTGFYGCPIGIFPRTLRETRDQVYNVLHGNGVLQFRNARNESPGWKCIKGLGPLLKAKRGISELVVFFKLRKIRMIKKTLGKKNFRKSEDIEKNLLFK